MSVLAPVPISRSARRLAKVDAAVEVLVEAFGVVDDTDAKAAIVANVEALVNRRAVLAGAVEYELGLLALGKEAS